MSCSTRHLRARRPHAERGQATVEAAFLLPLLFALLALLMQPVALLYNRCVMQVAAAETCRAAATAAGGEGAVRAYALRRLAAIPALDVFQDVGEGWTVELGDDAGTGMVRVTIVNRLRPLPLVGLTAGLLAYQLDDGRFEQRVSTCSRVVPTWAVEQTGDPASCVGAWQ